MKNTLNQYIRDFQQKHRNYRRYLFVLVILAVVTVAGVNWRLHGQGISMTSDYQCGKEEHTHSADCYEKTLICGKEETDGSEGHTHTDDCYTTERKLTCGEDEHTHGDECYDEDGNLICEKKEHTHGDECYTTEKKLTCGKEESKAVKAHHHTDDCYEEKLTCGKEEHTHSIECMIDESADVETSSDWEATLPDLTGSWDEDMAAIAASQVGYTESEKNFKLDDDGETKKGYTRYGEWYGNKYGDWSAMFAAFCLHYAGVDGVPTNSGVASFLTDVKSDAKDLCQSADDYNAKLGDLVFLDLEGDDGKADHIGILTKVNTEDKKTTSFKAVVGDLDGEVQEKSYKASSANIVAYVSLPEQAEEKSDDADDADEKTTEESEEASTAAKKTKKKSAGNANDAQSGEDGIATASEDDGTSTHDDSGQASTGVNMNGYITGVSFQKKNGVIWEESTEFTTADQVKATINFENVYTSLIKSNNNTLYIDLPAYIDCSKFTGTYETYDGGTKSGTYTYQKNDDGSYRIVLKLDDNYVNNAGDVIGGSMQFNFNWTKDAVDDSGTKKVEIGNWSGDIKITEDKSGDDKPSSANYSIWKNAGSLYYSDDGKTAYIDYTISLQVKQDTKAPIVLKDILTGEGFTYDDTKGVSVDGDTVKANFDSLNKETYSGNNPNTNIQLWAKDGDTIPAGLYTIKYRVQTVKDMSDPDASLPSDVSNKIETPKDGDSSISSETHTTITTGTINKQGQLVSGSDATYIDYTVYLNAGAIIKNLKEGANFTDTLPDILELQGNVTVKQYDVTGKEISSTTATVDGQNISYTTPTGQYYYVITYRTKVKDSELPIGGSMTIKNDGKSTGGVDGSSSSEITITNHKLTKILKNGTTGKDDSGNWIRTSNWISNVAVKGDLDGYVYEDWSDLVDDTTVNAGKSKAMELVSDSVVVKDARGNTVSSDLYTLEESSHTTSHYYNEQNHQINDGLFKITFKEGVTGPVSIEYSTTAKLSKLTYGYLHNNSSLSKDGHTDPASAEDRFDLDGGNRGLIAKKQDNSQYNETFGTTTLKPGENSIPWVILVNRDHTMTGDFTVTDTIKDGLIFLPDTLEIRTNQDSIKDKEGVTWSFNKETGKLTVSVKESAYKIENQNFTHTDVTIAFKTQLPDEVIKSDKTDNITYKNTATLETNGEQTDSTYEQKVIREVVGKSGSYDKNTHILSYNVVVNPDSSKLNSGNTLTVTDTLDAGSIADYVELQSLELFTAIKTTDSSGNVKVEPGKLVQELTKADSGSAEFTYTLDESGKSFTTYLPDSTAYVIVAKYYVDTDVSADVQMKNTVKIEGNDAWKKEDSSTKVEQNTSGETHTNKVTVVKHDSAQYSTVLAGAAFKLEKYDNSAWTEVGSATTGSDGTASINPVAFNTLYKLGETQAPDGYVLDEGPVYFVVATTGTSEEDAKKNANLPETIVGDSTYSKDAVKVYYAKTGKNDAINIEVDRYNTKDATKVEPGELRVNKVWVDGKGQTVKDSTDLAQMKEVSVTLTKHVANTGHTVTIKEADADWSNKKTQMVNPGGYIVFNIAEYQYNQLEWSCEDSNVTIDKTKNSDGTYTVKIGSITGDCTIVSGQLYWANNIASEGGTAPSGTTDTVIGTVTLNAANDWTYLWSNLDRSDGVTYTLTETTVDGYNVSYKLNGEDLEAGITFTPGESGDKLTVTNTANPEYDLPSTGGIGTLWYIAGGIALMGGSLLCGFTLRRRRERGGRVE